MDKLIEPFAPALMLVSTAASIIVGWLWLERIGQRKVREIVSEVFTGRAEADALWRGDHLRQTTEVIRDALLEHEKREREYVDTLRDKITEYHAHTIQAVKDAKGIAIHVSGEYQAIRQEMEIIKNRLHHLEEQVTKLVEA